MKLDNVDKKILRILQVNGRISNAELAEKVSLSPTPCLRRVKRLEDEGFIKGYRAELDRDKLGLGVSAVVFVQLQRNTTENAKDFELEIQSLPQVTECLVLTGQHDYLLRVTEKDLASYEKFIKGKLANVSHIDRLDTTIVLNQVVLNKHLPV